MKTCRDFESLLSLFAGKELDAEHSASVAAHLKTCVECRQKVTEYKQITNHLSVLASPILPETRFDDFHKGVIEKITNSEKTPRQLSGLVAVIYALYRRRRFVIAITTLLITIALSTLLTRYFHSPQESSSKLTQLLEKRDWMGLYYAMLDGESRAALLNEPVPASLLHAALNELVEVQRRDKKIRLGLEQVLSKIKTREGNAFGLSRSVQIFGKITATGYEPATRSRRITWNPQRALSALHQVDENKKMTIRQLLF